MITIRQATASDGPALQALQARCPQGASLIVSTVNSPDFFGRAKLHGEATVFVACEGERIVGSAACAFRPGIVSGKLERIGYEFQYFVDPDVRKAGIGRRLQEAISEHLRARGAVLSYAVIVEGNTPSLQLFSKQGFLPARELPMYGLFVYRELEVAAEVRVRQARPEDLGAVAALANQTWAGRELYTPLSAEGLADFLGRTPGMGLERLYVAEAEGRVTAALGSWDWGQITKIKIMALSPRLKLINFALKLGRRFRPLPVVPPIGATLNQWVLTPIGASEPAHLRALLRTINNQALGAGVDFMFFNAEPPHPFEGMLDGFLRADTKLNIYVKYLDPAVRLGLGPVHIPGEDA